MEEFNLKYNKIVNMVIRIINSMNLECQVEIKEEDKEGDKNLLVSVFISENARFLIGKNGQNLKSLEHVLKSIFIKKFENINNITVDINDYRKLRAEQLIGMARQAVANVRNTQKAEALIPMSAYERRIVHMELASYPDIATESIGAEPQRRIVIKPYP